MTASIVSNSLGNLCPVSAEMKIISAYGIKERVFLYYITQVSVKPPTFVIFVNDKELMHFSYTRYIENKIREAFGFRGTPLKFIIRERKENNE